MMTTLRGGLVALVALSACSTSESPTGPALTVNVAPLSLANVTNVCYALEVKNDGGQVVWRENHVCADQYGNASGGDLAYIGTCDASDIIVDGVARNTVTLAIESLHTTTSPSGATDWQNPCVDDAGTTQLEGCTQTIACVENADAGVTFDITVMRQANQGFFDVAVSFDDIFCSAKLDVVPSLMLRADGSRGPTAVLGFACTAGANELTTLYLDTVHIACDGGVSYDVEPFGPGGNLGGQGAGIYQAQVFHGREQLADYDKCYWNTSIGLGTLGDNCHLTTRATAAEDGFATAFTTPAGARWPVIDVDVALGGSTLVYGNNPLNGPNSGVTTEYVAGGETFDYAMTCGSDPVAADDGGGGPVLAECTGAFSQSFWDGYDDDFWSLRDGNPDMTVLMGGPNGPVCPAGGSGTVTLETQAPICLAAGKTMQVAFIPAPPYGRPYLAGFTIGQYAYDNEEPAFINVAVQDIGGGQSQWVITRPTGAPQIVPMNVHDMNGSFYHHITFTQVGNHLRMNILANDGQGTETLVVDLPPMAPERIFFDWTGVDACLNAFSMN